MKIVITVEVPDGASVSVADVAEPVKKGGKKPSAAESAPQAAAPAAPAPAPAAAPVQSAPGAPTLTDLNKIVSLLAGKDRDAAAKILIKHGAATVKTSTAQLKPEKYQVVIDETEEAIAAFDAAATQVANSGSLV